MYYFNWCFHTEIPNKIFIINRYNNQILITRIMTTRYNFNLMTVDEFLTWFTNQKIARTILYLQIHHTFSPNYSLFNGNNHFELQKGMKDYHVHNNGWSDIGQHFTIFPDGMIMTGRSLENSPACILGRNSNALCIENLGNFDIGGDVMTDAQKTSIVKVITKICSKLSIPVNTDKIWYHHWFRLSDGYRNDGAGGNKSCPGSNFFGGNSVNSCKTYLLPLVISELNNQNPITIDTLMKYVYVTSNTLNVREQPDVNSNKVTDREPAKFGAVLRVYEIKNNWYRISNTKQHWVSAQFAKDVTRATVNADTLNVRNQPSINGIKVGSVSKGEEVFIYEHKNDWSRIGIEEKWVSTDYLTI